MRGNNRSLRTSLVMAESVTIVLPLLILIFVMQARIGEILKSNVETEMQREIETADQMLNMMMDRYDSVLYRLSYRGILRIALCCCVVVNNEVII